jgi:hypothetical protein
MRIAILSLLLACGLPAHGQSPLTRSEQAFVDFGFATQLGSGVYTMSGRTLQVYRLPFGYEFDHADDARIRARLTLPVTFGFLDFKPVDVIETGLPETIDAASFVPGLALAVSVLPGWTLEPFAEAGVGRDRSSDIDQRIYSAGLRSYYDFGNGATDWQHYDELVHVGVEQRTLDRTNDFTRFRAALTARRPFDNDSPGRRADFLAYGFGDFFLDPADGTLNDDPGGSGDPQFEFGVTFGATEPIRVGRIPLPRVGLGYRFGSGLSVWRLVFGGPF